MDWSFDDCLLRNISVYLQLYVYLLSPRVKFKFYYIVLCSMIVLYEVMKYNTVIVQAF